MTPTEAKQIIEVLAKGIDPETGEVLPHNSPVNSPHVIRALFIAAKALEQAGDKPARPKPEGPGKAGKAWTQEEDSQLLAAFDTHADVTALAKTHQRTSGAIKSRLMKHGRIQPDYSEGA